MTPGELDRLIAAERAAPPQPPIDSAPAGWQRLERDVAAAVVPQFDVPPGVVESLAVAKTGASWGIVGKVLATVVIAGGGATAVVATRPEPVQAPVVEQAQVDEIVAAAAPRVESARASAPAAVEQAPVAVDVPLSPQLDAALDSEPEPRARKPRTNASASATAPESGGKNKLERERELVSLAQHAVAKGTYTRALDLLDQHAREFPHGAMAEDRDALRVVALCRAKRFTDAERRRTQFFRRWPKSLHASRVRGACGTDG
ncbi:MAG TPA: hypothetical protein VFG69_20365 [Nannocystaceae bacterium]|nr:hypothetical protein [Nannocystaceae bacterium]